MGHYSDWSKRVVLDDDTPPPDTAAPTFDALSDVSAEQTQPDGAVVDSSLPAAHRRFAGIVDAVPIRAHIPTSAGPSRMRPRAADRGDRG